ncbi:MAG: rod shape-determining protein MreC [Bacteroidales bacterium]|nr:rod shape-determining protein MreC [Bacteroidales bacterium]MBD5217755.1 rod shape-determining protein MreC [Bacteroidales bacterium]
MRTLLNFIIRYSSWFVYAFYIVLSCVLLFNNNPYQQSVYLTSANSISTSIYGVTSDITSYIALRKTNEELQANNALLEKRVVSLEQELKKYKGIAADTSGSNAGARYEYVLASVLNNSTRHPRNYFNIDKGYEDGIRPGMGVAGHNGVVGIVNVTGAHTSRIISLLNVTQHFSVKLKDTPYVGTLTWKGNDPTVAYVEEIPKHVKFKIGESVVTSGYSTTFPEGIDVGKVIGQVKAADDNYFTLKIKLSSDFRNLTSVRVIKDNLKPQLDNLEKYDNPDERP